MKKSKNKSLKKLKIVFILLTLIVLIFSYFNFYVNPQIVNANAAKIKTHSINILNSAITTTINENKQQ